MEEKHNHAIQAGIYCGIALIALSLIGVVLVYVVGGEEFLSESYRWSDRYGDPANIPQGMPEVPPMSFILTGTAYMAVLGLELLVFVLAGALAVKLSAGVIHNKKEAIFTGALAGIVAEIVRRPAMIVIDVLVSLIYAVPVERAEASLVSNLIGHLVCCLPVMIIVGAVLAGIGASIYAMIKLKV